MALARGRRSGSQVDYWPSFVDVLTNVLLVFIFLLSVFALTQFFLNQEISGRDTVLNRLNLQIAELTELLSLERAGKRSSEDQLSLLQSTLQSTQAQSDRFEELLAIQSNNANSVDGKVGGLTIELDDEKRVSQRALAQVEFLNQQISALRRQIAAIEIALDASESQDRESQTQIADLGRRLNVALAQRVQELSRYRSDFFGRLREILSQRSDIRVVGDRFVFQSEVLFSSGSDEMNVAGEQELNKLADAIIQLETEIPAEINWVIRVDGHTDSRPINSSRFRSNWELSAARAISVVRYLIERGVDPQHLVAAGFADNYPLEPGESDESLQANRRIELKLTER